MIESLVMVLDRLIALGGVANELSVLVLSICNLLAMCVILYYLFS